MKRRMRLTPQYELALAILAIALGTARVCYVLWSAIKTNGGPGFPLDDPWIHLQFARNLREFGSFSYFRSEMVTAGSTSPLYTLILGAGFFVTSNEMFLSYALGIAFFAASSAFFLLLLRRFLPRRPLLSLSGLLLFLLEPRMAWAALSGMETTLFIAGILASLYFFALRSWRWLAVSLGALLWIRPEGVLLAGILGAGGVYLAYLDRPEHEESPQRGEIRRLWLAFRVPAGIFLLFAGAYLGFNYSLSGAPFPNTFAAKTAYYGGGNTGFPAEVFAFLSGGHMTVIASLALIGAAASVRGLFKGERLEGFLILCWIIAMFLAYWKELPYLYQEGRYMMPVIPPLLMLGVLGASVTVEFLRRKRGAGNRLRWWTGLAALLTLIPAVQFAVAGGEIGRRYAGQCRYISDRQVKAAHWMHGNLPVGAVVATHDIGAIGFYSGRRVVDMVGLVSPQMIPNLHSLDSLVAFLVRERVTHIAVLRNWFEIVNVNPVFQTDESHPEIMEVFAFDPSRVHVVPGDVSRIEQIGLSYLASRNPGPAVSLFTSALRMDPFSSRLHLYLGLALLASGRKTEAEASLTRALSIQPTLSLARLELETLHSNAKPDTASTGASRAGGRSRAPEGVVR